MRTGDLVWSCSETTCARARACVGGECLPCVADSECEAGELCVLQYCLLEPNVGCQTRADCTERSDAICVMNGITAGDLRGNSELRSECMEPRGGHQKTRKQYDSEIADAVSRARAVPVHGPSARERALDVLRAARSD